MYAAKGKPKKNTIHFTSLIYIYIYTYAYIYKRLYIDGDKSNPVSG